MCFLALPQEYAFKIVLFLCYIISAAEEAILFLMEFAVSVKVLDQKEEREM